MTKAYFESTADMGKNNGLLAHLDGASPFVGIAAPLHPGAIRYYKEIGAWNAAADAQNLLNLNRQRVLMDAWAAFFPTAPEGYAEFEAAWMRARNSALEAEGLITLGEGL
jgi:hypothetical protein